MPLKVKERKSHAVIRGAFFALCAHLNCVGGGRCWARGLKLFWCGVCFPKTVVAVDVLTFLVKIGHRGYAGKSSCFHLPLGASFVLSLE